MRLHQGSGRGEQGGVLHLLEIRVLYILVKCNDRMEGRVEKRERGYRSKLRKGAEGEKRVGWERLAARKTEDI